MNEKDPNLMIAMLQSMDATRWMILGIVLLLAELVTGTTYILWIAAAAIVMAVLTFIVPIMGWEMQFILYFVFSIVLLVLGHKYVRPRFKGGEPSDLNDRSRTMVGTRVKAVTDFEVGKGRVQVGDTQWAASLANGTAKTGDELRVVSVKGATLQVEPAAG